MIWSLDMVYLHFKKTLRTHWLWNKIFDIPRDNLLDDFQGPLDFHGHGSWSVCKAALSAPSLSPYTIHCAPLNNIERSHGSHG